MDNDPEASPMKLLKAYYSRENPPLWTIWRLMPLIALVNFVHRTRSGTVGAYGSKAANSAVAAVGSLAAPIEIPVLYGSPIP